MLGRGGELLAALLPPVLQHLAPGSRSLPDSEAGRSPPVPVRAAFRASQATLGVRLNNESRPSAAPARALASSSAGKAGS